MNITNQQKKAYLLLLIGMVLITATSKSQPTEPLSVPIWKKKQTEISVGFAMPLLFSGKELERSKNFRSSGKSYFVRQDGSRLDVGSYPFLSGFTAGLGFYNPLASIEGLMIGGIFTTTLSGSQPSIGGYEEGYFFNFFTIALSTKYYPIRPTPFFIQGSIGVATVLTKNRFKNDIDQQNFFHQFGIGLGGSVSAGYTFFQFKDNPFSLVVKYDWANTRVEVNEIGDDNWYFGAIALELKFGF